jgi:hypothetical protein
MKRMIRSTSAVSCVSGSWLPSPSTKVLCWRSGSFLPTAALIPSITASALPGILLLASSRVANGSPSVFTSAAVIGVGALSAPTTKRCSTVESAGTAVSNIGHVSSAIVDRSTSLEELIGCG